MADQLIEEMFTRPPAWLSLSDADRAALHQQAVDASASPAQRERWKYTPLRKVWQPDSANETNYGAPIDGFSDALEVSTTEDSINFDSKMIRRQAQAAPDAVARLFATPCIQHLRIEAGCSRELNLTHQANTAPVLIHVEREAQLTLTETLAESISHFQDDLWLIIEDGAIVRHSRNTIAPSLTHCYRYLAVSMDANASYELNLHNCGAKLHRQDIHIQNAGDACSTKITCANAVAAAQHLDQYIVMAHEAPASHSNQIIHSIASERANITFNGRIVIGKDCPQVEAHLSNKNICLADVATINTKPELEIYTDDVACSHGATVGKLDENHLFYLASRGLAEPEATALLAQGFLNTCITGPLADTARDQLNQALVDAPTSTLADVNKTTDMLGETL